jgi:hypothetical protein
MLTSTEVEERYGVDSRTFRSRILGGASPEEAATRETRTVPRYEIRGEKLTAAEIKTKYGTNPTTFCWRLRHGWSPEQAALGIRYRVHGEDLTAAEVAAKYGVPTRKFLQRLRDGWSPDEAADPADGRLDRSLYTLCGHAMTGQRIAELFGVAPQLVRRRARALGWDMERAVFTLPVRRDTQFLVHGKKLTAADIAIQFDISEDLFRARIRRGIPPDLAVDARPLNGSARHRIHGKMLTVAGVAAKHGVVGATFRRRIKRGVPPEEAVRHERKPRRRAG